MTGSRGFYESTFRKGRDATNGYARRRDSIQHAPINRAERLAVTGDPERGGSVNVSHDRRLAAAGPAG